MSAPAFLDLGGPIAGLMGEAYEPRPQQLDMARGVASALEDKACLLAEAGTGVGKSFAYLVPAIERILNHGEKVVVATHTIALQEQLIHKDIPVLIEAFGDDKLRPVLVKGRGNYLSIRRLGLASQRAGLLLSDEASRRSLRVIEDWAYQTEDGSLSTLPALERPEVFDHARSDADNCMGRKCSHYEDCFYQSARREVERANLLICNHALFFADLALRAGGASILPDFDHVILDEAHGIEDIASEHFGLSLTAGRVHFLLRTLFDERRRKGYLASLNPANLGEGADAMIERTIMGVLRAGSAARDFFDGWLTLVESGEVAGGRIRETGLVENVLSPVLREVSLGLNTLKQKATREEDKFELNAYSRRAGELSDIAEILCDHTQEKSVYWVDVDRSKGRPRVSLACAPIEVAPVLREHLFEKEWGTVLTSATLATRTPGEDEPFERAEAAFAFFMARLGCEGVRTIQLGSPFDYSRQVELYIDRSMPDPRDPERFASALVPRVLDHVIATDGGAFCLFTSYAMLRRAASMLAEPLEALEMPMLVQGDGGPRSVLIERFKDNPRSVLLGTSSFWQGIDIRGDALRNVIITRLPFEPPDRPLTEARCELIKQRGGDPFREDAIPRAVIRFKQGFGRLIRSASDQGRVVVLDPRLATARYAKLFLAALPAGLEPIILSDESENS